MDLGFNITIVIIDWKIVKEYLTLEWYRNLIAFFSNFNGQLDQIEAIKNITLMPLLCDNDAKVSLILATRSVNCKY